MDRPMVYFKDLELGQTFPEYELKITEEIADKYFRSVEDDNKVIDETGKRLVPPTIASIFSTASYKKFIENPHGTLHTKSEYEVVQPLYVGDNLKIQASVVDKYKKKGNNFIAIKTLAEKEDKIALISRTTLLWGK